MGVELALSNALGEVTLVLFTTLGPASTLAYLIMLVPIFRDGTDPDVRKVVRKYLWIPMVICMLGLIASATHLGNPGNALYVLSRIGASPLSNEVFSAGCFLAACAIFWLLGFALRENRLFQKVMILIIAVLGLVFIASVSFAYNVETILTWHTPIVPASIAVSALVAGPMLAISVLRVTGYRGASGKFCKSLAGIALVASVVWLALQVTYGMFIGESGNSLMTASELVPLYWPSFGVSTALVAAGHAVATVPMILGRSVSTPRLVVSTVLLYAAIFFMRFAFYMAHMTVGITL